MFHISLWMCWLGLAIAALIVKLFSREYVSLAVAVGAFATAVAVFIGFRTLTIQILVFSIVTLIFISSLQPFAMRREAERRRKALNKTIPFYGKEGTVTQKIDNMNASGRVSICGESRKARSINGLVIEEGASITVIDHDGPTLLVKENLPQV